MSFTIQAGQIQSRVAGDRNTVDQVHYEVRDKSTGKLVISSVSGKNGGEPVEIVNKTATVEVRLVKGVECKHYILNDKIHLHSVILTNN